MSTLVSNFLWWFMALCSWSVLNWAWWKWGSLIAALEMAPDVFITEFAPNPGVAVVRGLMVAMDCGVFRS